MKKKIMTIIAVFVLVFAFATSALAANPYSYSSSSCYKTFITSGSLTKSTSQTWTRFTVAVGSLTYTGTQFSYLYARPQGTDGTLYASKKTVSSGGSSNFTPNTSGSSANTVKVKIYNADYEENSIETNKMTTSGSVSGLYS